MPPVDRRNPVRAASSWSSYTMMEFMREFPDDEACLEWLWRKRAPDGLHADCPKCGEVRTFKRYKMRQQRQSWTCTHCGMHVQPTAGTIFHGSSTSLHLWFYAIFLITSTRCGLSAKQLERELGVTYKTAWRMLNLIRNRLMGDDGEMLSGIVEIDETSVDGKPRKHMGAKEAMKRSEKRRVTVFAAVERGGRVKATVLPSRRGPRLQEQAVEWVQPETIVYTDEWAAYNSMWMDFEHSRVRHSTGEYVIGNVHTNTIEGFFGNLKTGIRGTYKKVSHKWLQSYLDEFTWRYNHRHGQPMFRALVERAGTPAEH